MRKKNRIRGQHMISFDLSKAFDSCWVPELLVNIYDAGIDGRLWNLLYSFLTTRTQKVKVNGVHSDVKSVKNGVPQGSVFSPTLFNIYVNPVPKLLLCLIVMFADDFCITPKMKEEKLQIEDLIHDCKILEQFA